MLMVIMGKPGIVVAYILGSQGREERCVYPRRPSIPYSGLGVEEVSSRMVAAMLVPAVTSHALRMMGANRSTQGDKEGTAQKRRVDVLADLVVVEIAGEVEDTLVVVFKSMVRVLLFTPEGEGHLSLMLIGRLCLEVVPLKTVLLRFR